MKENLNELELPFVVDGSVLEAIKSLEWSMSDNDAVTTGLSVWLLLEVLVGQFSGQAVWEMLYSNGAAPSLADATSLVKAKPGAPCHLYQARLQICHSKSSTSYSCNKTTPFASASTTTTNAS